MHVFRANRRQRSAEAGRQFASRSVAVPRPGAWHWRGGDERPGAAQRLDTRRVCWGCGAAPDAAAADRASLDAFAPMGVVRALAVAGLNRAARRRGLAVGAVDETSQVKQGERTAGIKCHYLGYAGKVANGIITVHLAYMREGAGHLLIAARQRIPRERIDDPAKPLLMGPAGRSGGRTKGQLAIALAGLPAPPPSPRNLVPPEHPARP